MIDKIVNYYEIDVWLLIRNQFFQILQTRFYINISIYTYHNIMCVGTHLKFPIVQTKCIMNSLSSHMAYYRLFFNFIIIILFNFVEYLEHFVGII